MFLTTSQTESSLRQRNPLFPLQVSLEEKSHAEIWSRVRGTFGLCQQECGNVEATDSSAKNTFTGGWTMKLPQGRGYQLDQFTRRFFHSSGFKPQLQSLPSPPGAPDGRRLSPRSGPLVRLTAQNFGIKINPRKGTTNESRGQTRLRGGPAVSSPLAVTHSNHTPNDA